jgi:hypothetical protein
MRNLKSKGSGLIGLIITVAIIAILIFGWTKLGGKDPKNQIEQGNDAIEKAKEAQELQGQNDLYLQNQLNGSADINVHGLQDRARDVQQ